MIIPVIAVYKSFKTKLLKISYFLQHCLRLNFFVELSLNLLLQHGDIEINPCPRGKCSRYFSFCHWNLNSLPAHNKAKVPLLQAFNTLHKFEEFVSQKHILILQFQLRRSLLLLMVINYFVQTILVIRKKVGYVYITKNLFNENITNVCSSFESATLVWVSCLYQLSVNPKQKRFICYSISLAEPESRVNFSINFLSWI